MGRPSDQGVPTRHDDWAEVTLTHRCNQRCFFCYEARREDPEEPSREEAEAVIRQVREKADQIIFCGMEALLRPDIVDLTAYAASLGLRPVIFTNGQALAKPGLLEALADATTELSFAVSFHFADADTFALGARTQGWRFDRVIEGLERVRDYNRAHPERRLSVSTETDLYPLNQGRLAEMRATLMAALGESLSGMRLGCLTPVTVHDIGIGTALDPMAERRTELTDFIATHPPEVDLGFVKMPLCLIPGHEHRSREVQYVTAGTVLTNNQGDDAIQRVELDTITGSMTRDIRRQLRENPYRWVCRGCSLVSLCRFERTHWTLPYFRADRAQKPTPFRDRAPADVLRRLDATPAELAAAERTAAETLGGPAFPEERIVAALEALPPGGPRLVDAWVDGDPILVVALAVGDRTLPFRLLPPGADAPGPALRIDYLRVVPPAEGAAADKLAGLRALAGCALPPPDAWADDAWFDVPRAERLRAAWRRFGERLWPGVGDFAGWRTAEATLAAVDGPLVLRLRHPDGAQAELLVPPDGGAGARVRFPRPPRDRDDPAALCGPLLDAVAARWELAPPRPPIDRASLDTRAFVLTADTPDGPRWATVEDDTLSGVLVATIRGAAADGDAARYEYRVHAKRTGSRGYREVGPLVLSYGHADLDGDAVAWADAIEAAMRGLARHPVQRRMLPLWRRVLGDLAARAGLTDRYTWELGWRPYDAAWLGDRRDL